MYQQVDGLGSKSFRCNILFPKSHQIYSQSSHKLFSTLLYFSTYIRKCLNHLINLLHVYLFEYRLQLIVFTYHLYIWGKAGNYFSIYLVFLHISCYISIFSPLLSILSGYWKDFNLSNNQISWQQSCLFNSTMDDEKMRALGRTWVKPLSDNFQSGTLINKELVNQMPIPIMSSTHMQTLTYIDKEIDI